ncbi:bile acid-CoA:amino acid N-acyltransferase-like isoform X2 [Thalassophryne amazonica]|uniref:bile acid-CoA:amino acid N-acyltransferase-like isoform X2 n=1 Tax=Thalassophryne amazonica TaxID=390379 RepID=UPI001471FE28|nr:bile acid-CoA:amino acid N-acyltransferase-like isoform X2 [Thalassophryne amazonica]
MMTAAHRRLSIMSVTSPPILSVVPSRALVDETFKVQVKNLPAGLPVTLHSLYRSEQKDDWEAYGHYVSDHTGTVSVPDDFSFGGTYTGKEAMGLLWSMCPVPGSPEGLRLRVMNVCSPMLVNISVYRGHVVEGFRDQDPLASVVTERWYMAPGVQRIEIREEELRGTLFIPPGPGPFPGLLDMWGGGGGLVEYRASLLASHGFVTLALDYYTPKGADTRNTELSLFESAFNVIKDHPKVIQDRVGIFGLSLGAVVTLNLAALSTVINVGRIKCPVLLVNGHDDQNWSTVKCSEDMAQLMRAAGNDHLLTLLNYPDAGHLIEPPFSPHFRATNFKSNLQTGKVVMLWGGQTKPHSDAQEDAWKKILVFLEQNLYYSPGLKARL